MKCGEIVFVMDIVSTENTNTKAINVTSTASINCCSKKIRDSYNFAYSFINNHITFAVYYYLLSLSKSNRTCYYFDNIIKF